MCTAPLLKQVQDMVLNIIHAPGAPLELALGLLTGLAIFPGSGKPAEVHEPEETRTATPAVRRTTPTGDPGDFSAYKPLRGAFEGKRILASSQPQYPQEARQKKIGGVVYVKVLLDADGLVTKACATSGDPLLRRVSEEAAMEFRFRPVLLKGKKVPFVEGTVAFDFKVHEEVEIPQD